MKKHTRFINARRRGFLKGAAAAGTAAATGTVAAELAPETVATAPLAPESRGYRMTDHVRTYYDRARF